jgi:DNA polymerase III alpha subunit (gram-positive type)
MLEPRQLKMSSNFNETFQSAMDLEVNQKEIEEH